jgi:hypothetical protein
METLRVISTFISNHSSEIITAGVVVWVVTYLVVRSIIIKLIPDKLDRKAFWKEEEIWQGISFISSPIFSVLAWIVQAGSLDFTIIILRMICTLTAIVLCILTFYRFDQTFKLQKQRNALKAIELDLAELKEQESKLRKNQPSSS